MFSGQRKLTAEIILQNVHPERTLSSGQYDDNDDDDDDNDDDDDDDDNDDDDDDGFTMKILSEDPDSNSHINCDSLILVLENSAWF